MRRQHQQLLRLTRETLIVLGIEQPHMVVMTVEHEFLGVLDGDQLVGGDLADQRFGECVAEPVGPETRMFRRRPTARRRKVW